MGIKEKAAFISDSTNEFKVEKNIDCASCDKVFKYESELKVHMKRMHLKIKDHFCKDCDKSFSTKSQLNTHFPTHKENNFHQNLLQANQGHQMKGQMMLAAWDRSMLNS